MNLSSTKTVNSCILLDVEIMDQTIKSQRVILSMKAPLRLIHYRSESNKFMSESFSAKRFVYDCFSVTVDFCGMSEQVIMGLVGVAQGQVMDQVSLTLCLGSELFEKNRRVPQEFGSRIEICSLLLNDLP